MNNIEIIYEDKYILAVHKKAGIATQTKRIGEKDLFSEIKNYLNGGYVGIINRLDQPVEGIVLIAKDTKSASNLENQIRNGKTQKFYRAEAYIGSIENSSVLVVNRVYKLSNYMKSNGKINQSEICSLSDKDAKLAELEYTIEEISGEIAKLNIHLLTGRHHQIRLQLSNINMPIVGDTKYGSVESKQYSSKNEIYAVRLCAYKYEFLHPVTNKRTIVEIK